MIKTEFFEGIKEIITDEIYLAESTNEIRCEIAANCWSIGIHSETAKQIEPKDIQMFLGEVKANRVDQVKQSGKNVDLLYYLWYDEQAGTLKLNFINAKHSKLPFGADVEIVCSEEIIIKAFLESKYVDGIPWSELSDDTDWGENSATASKVKVHKEVLYGNN